MGEENIVAAGKPVIKDLIGDLEFEISPNSFYQVNPVQTKRLYDKVREYCGMSEEKNEVCPQNISEPVILDLYCGVGTIGLYCADKAKQVIGIEIVKEAVMDANRNAVINGIVNARYICGQAEKILPEYVKAAGQEIVSNEDNKHIDREIASYIKNADIAVLDPPRAGCRPELLEAVAEIGVKRIVYVSCDSATLSRDIKLLNGLGYELEEASPVDMFPMTSSVECVALLTR